MRFLIEYKNTETKDETNRYLKILAAFLNFHLIDLFHGWTFECLLVRFVNFPKPDKKLKCKLLSKNYAEVELHSAFDLDNTLSIEQFNFAIEGVKKAIMLAEEIPLKSQKDYSHLELLRDLNALNFPGDNMELDELERYLNQGSEYQTRVKRVDGLLKAWKEHPIEHNRMLKGVRIYDKFEMKSLWPFAYIYTELFSNLLNRAEISTPGYREIYFFLAEDMDDAKQHLALDTWHKYTYCALDINRFRNSVDKVKSEMLFESLKKGLLLIADFDHLDKGKVDEVLKAIETKGTDSELTYRGLQKGAVNADIVFKIPRVHLEKTTYYLVLTNTKTSASGRIKIDDFDSIWVHYSLGKIKITKDTVEIVGRNSQAAQMHRRASGLPNQYAFKIEEVIKTEKL